jgi:outer membrane protein assembly factor BamB
MKIDAIKVTVAVFAVLNLAADWTVFRGDPAMTGVAPATAKLPETLAEVWTFKTGSAIEGAPAIVDNVVYLASGDKHLYAIELASGRQIWKTNLESPIKASPAVDHGRIFVGNSDGKVFAVDAKTGSIVWTFDTAGEITAGANFHNGNILIGSHDATLYCLSRDGKKLWDLKTDGPVNGSPAVVGDRTFVAGCDSVLHVVDAATGKELGSVDLGGQAAATAAVFGETIAVGTMSNTVIGVNWKTAKKSWSFEAPRRQQPFYSSAAVTESMAIVGSRDKRLYAIDRATGKERWSYAAEGAIDGSPVVVGSRVYCGDLNQDGHFLVLDLKNGERKQLLELDSPVTGSPAVSGSLVLVGTEKGTLYALGGK